MSLFNMVKRSIETSVKLPLAATWDVISMANMGEGSSTARVIQEHKERKQLDDIVEVAKMLRELRK